MNDFDHSEPNTLGPYRVEAKLGQGGMGTVYRGVHIKTGQRVAIKVLAGSMSDQPRFRRRFAAEIETLKKLNHPNIVRLIGYGENEGQLFYSMELVEGPSLLEHLRKVKRLDWDTTIGYGVEICAALKHAHDFGVIHRDLKPANLLIEPEGRIKLTDFGIAKLFGASEQTAAGSVLGTADYMAPEQATGGQPTQRTDLYSLGSLLYACLVGRPPFGGRNLTQVVYGLKHETPAPLDLVLPDVPPELAELVHELLEKNPEDRPPTALVVGKRLAAMRAGLRKRGEQTRMDLDSITVAEGGDAVDPIVHRRLVRERPESNVEGATAANLGADVATGFDVGFAPTLASQASVDHSLDLEVADPDEQITKRTHFETVPEFAPKVAPDTLEKPRGIEHWLSVIGLVIVLLAIGGIGIWLIQPEPAENLLASIANHEAQGDRRAADAVRKEFLRFFPDHAEADTVKEQLNQDDLGAMIRRVRQRNRIVSEQDPAQVAWLQAVELRDEQPLAAAAKLRLWLDVFGHPTAFSGGPGNNALQELVTVTEKLLPQLETDNQAKIDPRLERLNSWIEWGKQNLQGDQRLRFEEGLQAMYGEEAWAASALEKLRPQ